MDAKMYGVIFTFLEEYVKERHGGPGIWRVLLKTTTGQAYKIYFPVKDYADEEFLALNRTAAESMDLPIPVVLEDFGSFVGPRLMSFYPMYLKGHDTSTFNMIIHAGGNIHDAIHRHNPECKPPQLSAHKESNNVLLVHYHSHRQLCHMVRGIIRGLGEYFKEDLSIEETQCMYNGASKCIMKVTKS
ncbi:MAG: hypothetical protein GY790_06855 [Bacteroidetes bacterium]|nr:hypothetical protein [Bacteroidota bacterium]